MALLIRIFVALAVMAIASSASAQSIGVVCVDTPNDDTCANDVADAMRASGLSVLSGDDLDGRYRLTPLPAPDETTTTRFDGIIERIERGTQAYFYDGDKAAIGLLGAEFNLGIGNPAELARDPKIADSVYDAGIVLIRAYRGTGDEANATAVARVLVKTFPSKQPSPSVVPPKVIELIGAVAAELDSAAVVLKLDGGSCALTLNGAELLATGQRVAPSTEYFVGVRCGSELSVVRIQSPRDGALSAPVPPADPLQSEAPISTRDLVAIAHWADLESVVGVRANAAVVRVQPDGTVREASGAAALRELFPDTEIPEAVEEDEAAGRPVDMFAIGLVGGGAAMAGLSTYLLVSAFAREKRVACSELGLLEYNPAPEKCEGVDPAAIGTAETDVLRDNERAILIRRILGGTAGALAVGSIGYGVYRLMAGGDDAEAAAIFVSPEPGGVSAGARFQF